MTRSAEDEFLDCPLCGPFRQDGHGRAERIIDRIANREFHRELVATNRAVIEAPMVGETDVRGIVERTGIAEDMVRTVLADSSVFEISTFKDQPTMIVAAKLTPYGRRLGHIAHDERVTPAPRVPKKVLCPKCRKEFTVRLLDGVPVPGFETSVGAIICNGCCGFTVDDYGRVYP